MLNLCHFISEFLKNCNVVDMIDVLLKVHEAYTAGKEELKTEIDTTNLLFQCIPTTPVEVCNFTFNGRNIFGICL